MGSNQAGVSLLLAVLILAAVTAVAFSVATIIFIEIRSSGDSLRSEPNLYATLGLTEEALFQYKRGYEPNDPQDPDEFDILHCDGSPGEDNHNVCSINNVSLTLPGDQPLRFDNNPRVEYIEANNTTMIPLYEINEYVKEYNNIYVNVFPNEGPNSPIGIYFKKISASGIITYDSPGIDPTDPCPGGLLDEVFPGTQYSYGSFDTDNTEMYLVNCDSNQAVAVSIVTDPISRTDTSDTVHYGQPEGLPFTGRRVFRIVADNLGLTRTYQVEIPIP